MAYGVVSSVVVAVLSSLCLSDETELVGKIITGKTNLLSPFCETFICKSTVTNCAVGRGNRQWQKRTSGK